MSQLFKSQQIGYLKVKVSLCLFKCHTLKAKWGTVKVQLPTFLNVAQDGDEWSYCCPYYFTPYKGVLVSTEQFHTLQS